MFSLTLLRANQNSAVCTCCQAVSRRGTTGWFTSAFALCPQETHTKVAWL
jgi:hypothetical protein